MGEYKHITRDAHRLLTKVQLLGTGDKRVTGWSEAVHAEGWPSPGSCKVMLAELGGGLGKMQRTFQ